MEESLRAETLEFIAIALVELRGTAQPRELAELHELELEAEDASTLEQLQAIGEQAKNLRGFCEQRKSTGSMTRPMDVLK